MRKKKLVVLIKVSWSDYAFVSSKLQDMLEAFETAGWEKTKAYRQAERLQKEFDKHMELSKGTKLEVV